jgi:hypothetical protein
MDNLQTTTSNTHYIDVEGKSRSLRIRKASMLSAGGLVKVKRLLQYVADGVELKNAATMMGSTYQTSKNYLKNFYGEYSIVSLPHAVAYAFRQGWIK